MEKIELTAFEYQEMLNKLGDPMKCPVGNKRMVFLPERFQQPYADKGIGEAKIMWFKMCNDPLPLYWTPMCTVVLVEKISK